MTAHARFSNTAQVCEHLTRTDRSRFSIATLAIVGAPNNPPLVGWGVRIAEDRQKGGVWINAAG